MTNLAFFDRVRKNVFHGSMSQSQVDGCNAIIAACSKDGWADQRWVAYALGTANWETDHTMQPIREIGLGRMRAYGHPAGPWHQIFYGRGDVQLTWERNYIFATQRLHSLGLLQPSENLDQTPDLAMRPNIAGSIMAIGMREGWFTGHKLADYFNPSRTDWVNARAIINGHDHSQDIGLIAQNFWHALVDA